MTAQQWAAKYGGVTDGHLSNVLAGNRDSDTLIQKVDQFIDKQLSSISTLVA